MACALYRSGSLSGDNIELLEIDATLDWFRDPTKAGECPEDLCNIHGPEQHVHLPTRGPQHPEPGDV